jgi:hypothetical protein
MIIEQSFGGPRITMGASISIILAALSTFNIVVDSLTVAKSILLQDMFENLDARYISLYNVSDGGRADASLPA